MKKLLLIFFVLGAVLLLSGCVSGDRLARNTPFASRSNSFYRDGVNLFPFYYKEGKRQSILFPLIDIDDRGFAVRPFYHKDKDEHGILWPLAAFNKTEGWAGPVVWGQETYGFFPLFISGKHTLWVFPASWYDNENDFGVLPFFVKNYDLWWLFPASWYRDEKSFGVLPLFCRYKDFFWAGNVFKTDEMFLVFPIYGRGKGWFYFLNYIQGETSAMKDYAFFPLAYYKRSLERPQSEFYSPLFSFEFDRGELDMLNIGMLLYHYSYGKHHVFYPIADADFEKDAQQFWLWPLFKYSENYDWFSPFFLFEYQNHKSSSCLRIFYPLLFQHESYPHSRTTQILPWGLLWNSYITAQQTECKVLCGALWSSKVAENAYDFRVLWGAACLNNKDAESRRFSLLYKFFSYHRFKDEVKWEFFPFIKIMETSKGNSWSFCWRLLEKHDGGGHIFFIPWGKSEGEK